MSQQRVSDEDLAFLIDSWTSATPPVVALDLRDSRAALAERDATIARLEGQRASFEREMLATSALLGQCQERAQKAEAELARLRAETDTGVLQDDLLEMLAILGMSDVARVVSPHTVFQEALGVLKQKLRAGTTDWLDISSAPKGEPLFDAGCWGNSEWFLAKFKDGSVKEACRLPSSYGHDFKDREDTYYAVDWLIGWQPLRAGTTDAQRKQDIARGRAMSKCCTRCKTEKPVSVFNKAGKTKSGKQRYHPWCRACRAAYFQKHEAELRGTLATPSRDEVLEEVAKICDDYGCEGEWVAKEYAAESADEIAARIRALINGADA
jgi:hypothetical protein